MRRDGGHCATIPEKYHTVPGVQWCVYAIGVCEGLELLIVFWGSIPCLLLTIPFDLVLRVGLEKAKYKNPENLNLPDEDFDDEDEEPNTGKSSPKGRWGLQPFQWYMSGNSIATVRANKFN